MTDAWLNAFGAGLNIGVDVPTPSPETASATPSAAASPPSASQHVGDSGHSSGLRRPSTSRVDVPTVVAGNGVGNFIGGNVAASGDQHVGDQVFHASTPFGGVNVAVDTPTTVAGNGVGNFIGGSVTAAGDQHVGNSSFNPGHFEPLGAPDHGAALHHFG